MKNKSNILIKTISTIAIIFAITFTTSLSAQVPPQGAMDTKDNNGDSIPLDGGLAILLVGAAAFGIKKLRDAKNDKL